MFSRVVIFKAIAGRFGESGRILSDKIDNVLLGDIGDNITLRKAILPVSLDRILKIADAKERPAVTGTYFISKQNEQALMEPYPALFIAHPTDKYTMSYVHPLEPNAMVKVDYAGYGFFLMHRSVADKMRKVHGDRPLFLETSTGGDGQFISEDIQFFMLMKEAGIPLYAHTGATVQHMKRFAFDEEFYKLYWVTNMAAHEKEKKAEA